MLHPIAAPAPSRAGLRSRRFARASKLTVKAVALPPEYGYVLCSVAFTAGVVQWQAVRVSLARRESGVAYPAMYADGTGEAANNFNCVQRSHQNTLETLPQLLAMEALLALQYPVAAAGMGVVWTLGRILYTLGYSTGDPSKRLPGVAISGLTYLGAIVATAAAGAKMAGLLP